MPDVTVRRNGEMSRGVLTILSHAVTPMRAAEVLERLARALPPTEYEMANWPNYPGQRRYEKLVRFATIEPVKAGWMTKSAGRWAITERGREALRAHEDPLELQRAAARLYRLWRREQARRDLEVADEAIVGEPPATEQPRPPAVDTRLFHRVNRLIPEAQDLVTVSLDTPAGDALALMLENNYSQLPVVAGTRVLGAFTLRSFARGLLSMRGGRADPLALPVDDYIERLSIVHVTDEIESILEPLDADGAVLVGSPGALDGVVTPADALRYLYRLSSAYIQLQEIEQSLRDIIARAVPPDELAGCIRAGLAAGYAGREAEIPTRLIDLTFGDYAAVIGDGRNWARFEPFLGGDRARVRARLERVGAIRNEAFHFKGDLTDADRGDLVDAREWLLRRVQVGQQIGATDD